MPSRLILVAVLALVGAALPVGVLGQERDSNDPAETPVPDGTTVRLELLVDGLTSPVQLTEAPDDSGRRYVVDQIGLIRIITQDGTLLDEPFLDIRDRIIELNPEYDERGLLGLAFHPNYAENGRFFVFYSIPLREEAPDNYNHTNVLAEFRVSTDNPDQADPTFEQILLVAAHKP